MVPITSTISPVLIPFFTLHVFTVGMVPYGRVMVSFLKTMFTRYRLVSLLSVFFTAVILFFLISVSPGEEDPVLILESHPIRATTDSDRDGVPDWQEEIAGSDYLSASSFPYKKDLAEAKQISVDDLLYGGPGEYTEEIVRRFLLDNDGTASVSDTEREKFINASVEYFLKQVELRGLPPVHLSIDTEVSRAEVWNGFFGALKRLLMNNRLLMCWYLRFLQKIPPFWRKLTACGLRALILFPPSRMLCRKIYLIHTILFLRLSPTGVRQFLLLLPTPALKIIFTSYTFSAPGGCLII